MTKATKSHALALAALMSASTANSQDSSYTVTREWLVDPSNVQKLHELSSMGVIDFTLETGEVVLKVSVLDFLDASEVIEKRDQIDAESSACGKTETWCTRR